MYEQFMFRNVNDFVNCETLKLIKVLKRDDERYKMS